MIIIEYMHMKSYAESRTQKVQFINDIRNEVNELINSIFTMQLQSLQREIVTSSKIVGQLLHNDIITHARSMPSLKLLIYELIIKLAQRSHSSIHHYSMQSTNQSNSEMYQMAIKKILYSVKEIIVELSWTQPQIVKSKYKTEKTIGNLQDPVSKLHYYHQELQNLIRQYQNSIKNIPMQDDTIFDEEGNNALIEQLEDVITKKEERIKQLNKELQQANMDNKTLEQTIEKLQIEKDAADQQILQLKQKIDKYQKQTHPKSEFNEALSNGPHFYFSRSSEDNKEELLLNQKDIDERMKEQNLNNQNLERLLFAQAISLEVLLQDANGR